LQDNEYNALFTTGAGGGTITSSNIQHITVIGDDGISIYTGP
jgi:site-specific recombinase